MRCDASRLERAARELLDVRDFEWSGHAEVDGHRGSFQACPACGGLRPDMAPRSLKNLHGHGKRCPLVTLRTALAATEAQAPAVETVTDSVACRHGWRGTAPEHGERIVTPCPACGSQSLFIGTGGHLTCAVVPHGDSRGCPNPDVKSAIDALRDAGRCHVASTPEALEPEQADEVVLPFAMFCYVCGEPAACIGYERGEEPGAHTLNGCCNDHCGHGNESERCVRLAPHPSRPGGA